MQMQGASFVLAHLKTSFLACELEQFGFALLKSVVDRRSEAHIFARRGQESNSIKAYRVLYFMPRSFQGLFPR